MTDNNKYIASWSATCQERLGEPVLGIVSLSRAGSLGRLGVGKLSPAAAIAMGAAAKSSTGGFPNNVLCAITDKAVHVFDYRQKRVDIKLKNELAVWPREGLRLTAERSSATTQVTVALADGTTYAMEYTNMGAGFNEPGLRLLGLV
jgi:NaMN:DMB phosphoribosyltransferase